MLATLTTISTPKCSEGVEMSGDVGRSLGPLFIVIFMSEIQTRFKLLQFIRLRLPMQRLCSARGVSDITLTQILFVC